MMTSLSRQLQQLAVPYTRAAFAPDKTRKSLLFDPKEAASLDRETIFALGSTGLEELENIDETLGDYRQTLYNESSQEWVRSMQTRETNEQLDENINEFLVKVSPYLLIKSTHKALEWLIYRFNIHQMNVDTVMMCILPYHQTNIFCRILQLMEVSDKSSKWNWLLQVQKSGVTLSRLTLINHVIQDKGFLSFICDFPTKYIKILGPESEQLRTVISFYACTVLGALQNKHEITEKTMSVLVPNIIRGLKSKCKSYKAATYMILSQLAVQIKVQEDFLDSLLPVLTKRVDADLSKEMLVCLTILYQTQKIGKLPKRSFNHLSKLPGLTEYVSSLCTHYDMSVFIGSYLQRLVPRAIKSTADSASSGEGSDTELLSGIVDYTGLLTGLLQGVQLPHRIAVEVSSELLASLLILREERNEDEWREVANVLLSIMDRKYSMSLDKAVEDKLCEMETQEERAALNDILRVTSSAVKYQMVTDDSTTLYLGLHHTRSSLRTLAVEQLASSLNQNMKLPEGFAEGTLIARLHDDSPSVVEAVLKMREKLLDIFGKEKLAKELVKLINKCIGQTEWLETNKLALDLLTNTAIGDGVASITFQLLPFILVRHLSKDYLEPAFVVMSSELAKKNALLKNFFDDWLAEYVKVVNLPAEEQTNKAFSGLNWVLVEGFINSLHKMKANHRTATVEGLCRASKGDNFVKLLACAVCCEVAVQCQNLDEYTSVLRPLLNLILESGTFEEDEMPTGFAAGTELKSCMGLWVTHLHKSDKLHMDLLIWIVDRILTFLPRILAKMSNKDARWWNSDTEFVRCLVEILDRLVSDACAVDKKNPWKECISKLMKESVDPISLSKLLCVIITWNDKHSSGDPWSISATLQVGSLHLLNKLLQEHSSPQFLENTPVFETLMVTTLHEAQLMRQGVLMCIRTVKSRCAKQLPRLNALLKKISKRAEEVTADAQYFPLIVKKLSNLNVEEDTSCVHEFMSWIENPATPVHTVNNLLRCVVFAPDQIVVERSLPLVSNILQKCETSAKDIIAEHIQVLEQVVSRFVWHVTQETLDVLLHCLRVDVIVSDTQSPQMVALSHISKELFRSLPSIAEQQKLLSALLDVAESSLSSSAINTVHKTLRKFKLDGAHVTHELSGSSEGASTQETVKQRRRSKRVSGAAVRTFSWRRATILLETLQTRKSVHDPHLLLAVLFALLTKLLNQDDEEVEYRKRLVLSCIHNITKKWPDEQKKPTQESINMESLVKCVSNSTSLQTQQQALLVMASVANFFPDYMLHNVMSVFTFVGGGLLQQDDNYSLQVITTTVQTIIPALLKAHKESKQSADKLNDFVASILQVFVDARHAVPKHRCMLVFQTLVETLGSDLYLWMIAVLVMQSSACSKHSTTTTTTEEQEWTETGVDADSMFCINIYEQFSARTQMSALTKVLHFIQKLTLCHNPEASSTPRGRQAAKKHQKIGIVDMTAMSPQEIRLFQYHLTKLIAAVLQHEAFIGQIVFDIKDRGKGNTSQIYFKEFVQEVLTYMTTVASLYGQQSTKQSQAKFWRALISKVYDILDKVNYLLPTDSLLEVVGSLVTHELVSIRRKALDLLGNKLQQLEPNSLKRSDVQSLLQLVSVLTKIAEDASGGTDGEFVNCRQHALFSLKLICRLLAHRHPQHFIKIYDVVVPMLKDSNLPVPILGVSLLCLAELCAALKAHSIGKLSVFVPPLIDLLKRQDFLLEHDTLLTCSLVTVQKLLSTLPHFLSPYLFNIILGICELSDKVNRSEDINKKSQCVQRISAIKQLLCTNTSPRVLIPTLFDSCDNLVKSSNPNGLKFVAEIVQEHIRTMKKEDLSAQHSALVNFFCKALDLRNASKLKLSLDDTDEIEDSFISGVLAMVVRLSENSFRPMYYKLYDWACREDDAAARNRQLAFFKISNRLAEKLKGLFNLFVGHSLQSMCQTLQANHSKTSDVDFYGSNKTGRRKSCVLLTSIINCLYQCMLHDTEGLFLKDVFKMVMQPLVDQIDNYVGGDDEYEKRIMNSVVPCISQLAVASKDDAGWKSLNYQVILKTRHTSPKVRFGALQVEEEIANKLGEEFMVLLPEAIPFLAELMEDEVEEVEQKCQEVIRSIEQAVNEDLQKYF